MADSYAAPGLLRQLWWRFQRVQPSEFACSGFDDLDHSLPADVRSFVENSYPRNHTFVASGNQLLPKRKLVDRVARLSRHYPQPLDSLVDLSCSKGFFVFHAAMQPGCRRVMGVDLDEQCLTACQALNTRFARQSRVNFARLTLPEMAGRIDEFGGPFQVALLVNTYQYLVFGSTVAPAASHDHSEIFRLLRQVCSGRLIFHNRLSFADLQSDPQERARQEGTGCVYEPGPIREAAARFFHVTPLDPWSRRPVWLLDAR
ncbi:MAG TPA: hypothetical protein VL475_08950 [Planctomycetaceae bacterium]|nr:hypothetical protein [Planctomycetaceae bacterium]